MFMHHKCILQLAANRIAVIKHLQQQQQQRGCNKLQLVQGLRHHPGQQRPLKCAYLCGRDTLGYMVAIPIYKQRADHVEHSSKKKKKATLWRIVWWRSGNHLIAGIFYVLHLVTGNVHLWLWLRDWNKFITNPGT